MKIYIITYLYFPDIWDENYVYGVKRCFYSKDKAIKYIKNNYPNHKYDPKTGKYTDTDKVKTKEDYSSIIFTIEEWEIE